MATINVRMSARDRARAAKLTVDAERVERDKKIEEQTTKFYLGSDERDKARAAGRDAAARMAASVVALVELDVRVDQVATLCGIEPGEVRALRKVGKGSAGQPGATSAKSTAVDAAKPGTTVDQDAAGAA